jgi:RNA polymerase sigma-70 factor (ECF subfamily)
VRSDDELAALARGGSREAMEELYARYRRPLLGYAARVTGDAAAAEDVFQETFVYFFQHLEQYEPRGKLGAYLFTIARSFALDEKRLARRSREAVPPPEPAAELPTGPLRRALQELSPALREIVELRLFQDLDYARIAEITGLPEATARSRMRYALEALRKSIPQHEKESGGL